jgi:hypothetical protein
VVTYTHGVGVDRPLTVTRKLYGDKMISGPLREFAPFTIVPYWNTRGVAEEGGFGDGTSTHCLAKIQRVVGNGSPALLFRFDQPAPKADVRFRVPVEGEGMVEEPGRIHCLLHMVHGLLYQLEFFRENGDPIDVVPSPAELEIIVNG